MTRFLLNLSLALVAAFAVFNVAARTLGTLQPPNPALAGFTEGCEDKPQPCWYGIVPYETTFDEAKAVAQQKHMVLLPDKETVKGWANLTYKIYSASNISPNCKVQFTTFTDSLHPTVAEIGFFNCSLYLADILDIYPEIAGIALSASEYGTIIFHKFRTWIALAHFTGSPKPYTHLNSFYIAPYLSNSAGGPLFKWQGYGTYGYYCRLEPQNGLCL